MARDLLTTTCTCHVCTPKKPREPGTPFGVGPNGEWRQLSTFFYEFAEARWQRRSDRRNKREEELEP